MRLSLNLFFYVLFLSFLNLSVKAEMTLNNLIFDDTKPYHLKILDALPIEGKIQIGPDNATHTIIEFFDYFCGYCKNIIMKFKTFALHTCRNSYFSYNF